MVLDEIADVALAEYLSAPLVPLAENETVLALLDAPPILNGVHDEIEFEGGARNERRFSRWEFQHVFFYRIHENCLYPDILFSKRGLYIPRTDQDQKTL